MDEKHREDSIVVEIHLFHLLRLSSHIDIQGQSELNDEDWAFGGISFFDMDSRSLPLSE